MSESNIPLLAGINEVGSGLAGCLRTPSSFQFSRNSIVLAGLLAIVLASIS